MKFGIIRFPESNGHEDMAYALVNILEQETIEVWHKTSKLPKLDAIIIPGGNGKGKLRMKEPVINEIIRFANRGGFVLGIGFGFQILCEIGLLQGKLIANENKSFYCDNIYIKPKHTYSALTALLKTNMAYKIPLATWNGKFHTDDNTIKQMREKEQVLFQYCTQEGHLKEQANPNGSRANIASICNAGKNVYGIIPQPERAVDDEIGNTDGVYIFNSIFAYLK